MYNIQKENKNQETNIIINEIMKANKTSKVYVFYLKKNFFTSNYFLIK